jgi:ketosteroid isomerase-like protein
MSYNLETIAAEFVKTLENRSSFDELSNFYHPNIEQIEFPNAITKQTASRNLQDLKDAAARGQKVLQKEKYDIVKSYTIGNTVIIEAVWTGTLAIPLGNIPIGGEMKAYFAQFYEFQDGKIIKQRNYDCFEPFN